MSSIAMLFFTNETNIPILKITLRKLFESNPNLPLKVYVVANDFKNTELPYSDKIRYISADVPYHHAGKHFSKSMLKGLEFFEEDYVFFFCDDYVMTKEMDAEKLNDLLEVIKDEDIDLFSFAAHDLYRIDHKRLEIDYEKYGFDNGIFYSINPKSGYQHAYSVQPCVWKKDSLVKIFSDNPDASLHDMDNSILLNKDDYKIVCTHFRIYDLACEPGFFIISYIEIIRHRVFLTSLNGNTSKFMPYDKYVNDMIVNEKFMTNPEYKKYILFTEEDLKNY